jgi:hypothetical protein
MKTVCPTMVAALIFGQIPLLTAQNLTVDSKPSATDSLSGEDSPRFDGSSVLDTPYQVPGTPKATATPAEGSLGFASQNSRTLSIATANSTTIESVVDLSVLREPSHYRRLLVSNQGSPADFSRNLQQSLAEVSAVYRPEGLAATDQADCPAVALAVEKRIQLDPAKLLETIESEVSANPACACEIVKAAITAADAETELVTRITQVAITAAPEHMRLIAQCAIASTPEALPGIQAILAELDPGRGESHGGAKSGAKSAKSAKMPIPEPPKSILWGDPLDLPPPFPILPPVPILPPPVTDP